LFTELALTRERKEFDAWLDGLARAGLIAIANETFTNAEGKEITYRKATITHEGRTPDDATMATVWLRTMQESAKTTRKRRKAAAVPVRRTEYKKPVVEVNRQGLRAGGVNRAIPPIAPKNGAMDGTTGIVELNDVQIALEMRLKEWRREQARAAGLPSFFIFSDTVLRSIAVTGPKSVGELREVRGVGPDKLERFGAAVVELCRA
jgi:ATP-dependent DNA helicase RecQ